MFLKHLIEKKTEIQTKENLGKRLLSKRKKIECLYHQTLQNMCVSDIEDHFRIWLLK